MCRLMNHGSKLRLHPHDFSYFSKFQALTFPNHKLIHVYGIHGQLSDHILPSLAEKWRQPCVFQLCSVRRSRISSRSSEFPSSPLASRWEMLRCRVVHLHIPHTALNTHIPPLATVLSGAHTLQRAAGETSGWQILCISGACNGLSVHL